MKKICVILIFLSLFLSSCSKEPTSNCFVCGNNVAESKLAYIADLENYVCNKCDNKTEVRCPNCKLLMDRFDYSDHLSECEVYCCYCGIHIFDQEHAVPYYCNDCAKIDWSEHFCSVCGAYTDTPQSLVNNKCARCNY